MAEAGELSVTLYSGGLDSTVLLWFLHRHKIMQVPLLMDYGQANSLELLVAKSILRDTGYRWKEVDIRGVRSVLDSALTNLEVSMPKAHYLDPETRKAYVPNRNMILLSIAWGAAISYGADMVSSAIYASGPTHFPDTDREFADRLQHAAKVATVGYAKPELRIFTPFQGWTKKDVVQLGYEYGAPMERTLSCYDPPYIPEATAPLAIHCGECPACVKRKEAFEFAGVPDKTRYIK